MKCLNCNDQSLIKSLYSSSHRLEIMARFHISNFSSGQLSFPRIARLVNDSAPKVVMDVGCGAGNLWATWPRFFGSLPRFKLILCDQSKTLLEIANFRLKSAGLYIIKTYCIDLDTPRNELPSVDVVLTCQVLHHLKSPKESICYLANYIKPGGCIIATTCHSKHMEELFILIADFFNLKYEVARGLQVFDEKDFQNCISETGGRLLLEELCGNINVTNLETLDEYIRVQPIIDQLGIRKNEELVSRLAAFIIDVAKKEIDQNGYWNLSTRVCIAKITK